MKKTGRVHVCQTRTCVYNGPYRIRHGHTACRLRSHNLQERGPLQILQQQEVAPVVLPASEDSNHIRMMERAKNSQLSTECGTGNTVLRRIDRL